MVHQQTAHGICCTYKKLSVCSTINHNTHAQRACCRHHEDHIVGYTWAAHTHTTRCTQAAQPDERQINRNARNVITVECNHQPGHTLGEMSVEEDIQQSRVQPTVSRVFPGNTCHHTASKKHTSRQAGTGGQSSGSNQTKQPRQRQCMRSQLTCRTGPMTTCWSCTRAEPSVTIKTACSQLR